jgi:hypothetical protein
MEGLGMSKTLKELSPETMRVLNKVKAREEMKKYSECRASWEMQNLINSVDIKAKTNHYKEMGEEFHARMEKVIRESLSEFELDHLEVRITSQRLQRSLAETSPANVSEGKYSVDYGVDSSLIRREKTSQVDKSNKYIEGWKIPEGGEIRLLKDCSFGYSRHYRLDTEAELSPEDVEKIKESWRKASSINMCHEIKKVEEPVEEMFVEKNVIGFCNPNLFQFRPGYNVVRFISRLWSYECGLRDGKVLVSQDPKKNNLKRYKALVIDRRDGNVKILDMGPEVAYSIFKLENHEKWGSCQCYDLDIVVDPYGGEHGLYLVYPEFKFTLSDSELELKKLADYDKLKRWHGHGLPWHMVVGVDLPVIEESQLEAVAFFKRSGFLAINEIPEAEFGGPVAGSEEPGRGLDESRGVYREKPALEAKSCGCVGNYICWECRL